ncbi:hypothetical protein TNCV_4037251 [Trichonephila clavipes]|nr:hypothetical protein TNCV_4037251 [Trichonephila clavipes]
MLESGLQRAAAQEWFFLRAERARKRSSAGVVARGRPGTGLLDTESSDWDKKDGRGKTEGKVVEVKVSEVQVAEVKVAQDESKVVTARFKGRSLKAV